jgi:hypothetical protein
MRFCFLLLDFSRSEFPFGFPAHESRPSLVPRWWQLVRESARESCRAPNHSASSSLRFAPTVFASRFFATGRIFFADLDLRTRIPVASFFLTARFFMSSFVFLAAYQFPLVDLPVPAWDFLVPAPRCCQVLRFSAVSRSALPAGLDSARFIRFSASGAVPSPCSIFARLPGIRRSQFFYSLGRFCCPFFFYGFHFTSL